MIKTCQKHDVCSSCLGKCRAHLSTGSPYLPSSLPSRWAPQLEGRPAEGRAQDRRCTVLPSGRWGARGEVTVSPARPPGWPGCARCPVCTGPSPDLPSHACSHSASSSPGCLNFSPAEPHFAAGEAVCLTEGFLEAPSLVPVISRDLEVCLRGQDPRAHPRWPEMEATGESIPRHSSPSVGGGWCGG